MKAAAEREGGGGAVNEAPNYVPHMASSGPIAKECVSFQWVWWWAPFYWWLPCACWHYISESLHTASTSGVE